MFKDATTAQELFHWFSSLKQVRRLLLVLFSQKGMTRLILSKHLMNLKELIGSKKDLTRILRHLISVRLMQI